MFQWNTCCVFKRNNCAKDCRRCLLDSSLRYRDKMSNDEYSFYSCAAVAVVFNMSFCQNVNLWQDRAWRRKRKNEIKGEHGVWLEASERRERRGRRSSVRLWTEPLWSPLRSPVFKESCGLRCCLASLLDPRTEIGEGAHILWLLSPPTTPDCCTPQAWEDYPDAEQSTGGI